MTDEELLAEVENLLRSLPTLEYISDPGNLDSVTAYHGRANAVVRAWDVLRATFFDFSTLSYAGSTSQRASLKCLTLVLHEAQNDLRMKTVGPLSTAIGQGQMFEYFNELRRLIETATNDLLFVDPYLDADFVEKYLPFAKDSVDVRLLGRERASALAAAVAAYNTQYGTAVKLRTGQAGFHDRYLFVDRSSCYQSGASFKDGAQRALTTITQITDAFTEVHTHYEAMWDWAVTRIP